MVVKRPATVLELEVNGRPTTIAIDDDFALLCDVLRDGLQLFGTKTGCREGICGSCNVLLDGEVVRSCLVLAGQAEGRRVETIEGLSGTWGGGPRPAGARRARRGAVRLLHPGHGGGAHPPADRQACADA